MKDIRRTKIHTIDELAVAFASESAEGAKHFEDVRSQINDDAKIVEFWNGLVEYKHLKNIENIAYFFEMAVAGGTIAGSVSAAANAVATSPIIVAGSVGFLGAEAVREIYENKAYNHSLKLFRLRNSESKLEEIELMFNWKNFDDIKQIKEAQKTLVKTAQEQEM